MSLWLHFALPVSSILVNVYFIRCLYVWHKDDHAFREAYAGAFKREPKPLFMRLVASPIAYAFFMFVFVSMCILQSINLASLIVSG
jgi:hypothetical protein